MDVLRKSIRVESEELGVALQDYSWIPSNVTNVRWYGTDLRNQKLAECDWTQIFDVPLTQEQKTAWGTYRQALQDLPENITDPKPLVNDMNNS